MLLSAVMLTGCMDASTREIAVPVEVAGSDAGAFIEGRDGWQVALSRADVAFGPLYLCSGVKAGDLCETARAEWTGSVLFDALDASPQRAGMLDGSSGVARSWMYDHGVTSLLTKQEPLVLDAAEQLGGSSVVIEGSAQRGDVTLTFRAAITVQQEEETEIGVPVIRKSASDAFEHEITGDEAWLLVRFDARPWVSDVDFTSLAEEEATDLTFEPDGQAFRAIRNAVVAGERPTFEWGASTSPSNQRSRK